jgi:2-methylcitrate dehydratase PrpD
LGGFVGKPFEIREFPHCDAIFSLRYTCATALLNKCVKQQHFTEQAITDVKMNQLISKIKLEPIWAGARPGIEVKVKINDGSELVARGSSGKGDPIDSPLTKAEIIAKYRGQVEFSRTVDEKKAEKLIKLLEKLEESTRVSQIIDLAAAAKK